MNHRLIKDNHLLRIYGDYETAKYIDEIDIKYGQEYPVIVDKEVVYIATSEE